MKITELHSITTYDGLEYVFGDGANRWLLVPTPGNWGLPPIKFNTERGYKQDGVRETSYLLNPRTITLRHEAKSCSRDEYWQSRLTLLEVARPNRNGQYVTYTFIQQNGTKRSIRGRPVSPTYPSPDTDSWNEHILTDDVEIECFDPVWFDPDAETVSDGTGVSFAALVFPFYFPDEAFFGGSTVVYTGLVSAYPGTWYSFPVITVHGQFNSLQLTHVELGVSIRYLNPVTASEELVIDLAQKTVTIGGVNKAGYLSPTSDITAFKIEPTPIVVGGTNTIQAIADNTDANTALTVEYYTRYIGI